MSVVIHRGSRLIHKRAIRWRVPASPMFHVKHRPKVMGLFHVKPRIHPART
jgi:hypothetical protein